jgi:hypothetical protein
MSDEVIKTTVSHRVPIALAAWIKKQAVELKVRQSDVVVAALERAKRESDETPSTPQAA